MPEVKKLSTYSIPCHDVVNALEFCPYEWSCHLIAIGTPTRVIVGSCKFQEEFPEEINGVEFTTHRQFHHGSRVIGIAWSPETTLLSVPKEVRFCTIASDHKVRLFSSNLKANDTSDVIGDHRDYINDVCFQPDKGDMVASVSDDLTCKVWALDGSTVACFPLGAPGMSVTWHKDEPGKIMVSEKKGIIRFYNVLTQQAIMSLDSGLSPLIYAHSCPKNPLQVAAAAGTDILVFDTSRSSQPIERLLAHSEGCQRAKWCRSHEHLLATYGRPGKTIKVFNMRSDQATLQAELVIADGMSWHHRLPLLAVGGDKQVHFWMVDLV